VETPMDVCVFCHYATSDMEYRTIAQQKFGRDNER